MVYADRVPCIYLMRVTDEGNPVKQAGHGQAISSILAKLSDKFCFVNFPFCGCHKID